MVISLKKQICDYRILLNTKDEEIANLKNNGKVSKFHDLETRFKSLNEEFNNMNEKYTYLKALYSE